MPTRKIQFVNDEFYHVYNRGVDKRDIFLDKYDLDRFIKSMLLFNNINPIGSIYEKTFGGRTPKLESEAKLVDIVAFCLNPNHYHFILMQATDGGISEFMKRLNGGYTSYFNEKNNRSGALFQGKFKAIHIDSNEYLLHLSAYVNLNNSVHKFGGPTPKFVVASSWKEYIDDSVEGFCKKGIILNQFKDKNEYALFAKSSLELILEKKEKDKNLNKALFD